MALKSRVLLAIEILYALYATDGRVDEEELARFNTVNAAKRMQKAAHGGKLAALGDDLRAVLEDVLVAKHESEEEFGLKVHQLFEGDTDDYLWNLLVEYSNWDWKTQSKKWARKVKPTPNNDQVTKEERETSVRPKTAEEVAEKKTTKKKRTKSDDANGDDATGGKRKSAKRAKVAEKKMRQ
eukprot:tig00000042_g15656.t1